MNSNPPNMTEFVVIPRILPPRNNRWIRVARQSISAFLKLGSSKVCLGFREKKMRNGGRVLLVK